MGLILIRQLDQIDGILKKIKIHMYISRRQNVFFSWCSPCFSYGTNASRKGNFENCLWKKLQNFRLASNLTIIQFSILHGQKLSHDSPQCNWMLKTFQHSWVWKSFLSSPLWPILINFVKKNIYTPGPWLLRISVMLFSLVCIFKK